MSKSQDPSKQPANPEAESFHTWRKTSTVLGKGAITRPGKTKADKKPRS